MTNNDPKGLWQNQETSGGAMSVQEMRAILEKRHNQTQRLRWVFAIAFLLYSILSLSVKVVSNGPQLAPTGWLAVVRFGLLIISILGLRYYVAEPVVTSLNLNAGAINGVEFYRRELTVQLDYFREVHRWLPGLLYLVLVFTTTLIANPSLAIPLAILLAIFGAYWYAQWRRDLPAIQEELRSLETFTRTSSK